MRVPSSMPFFKRRGLGAREETSAPTPPQFEPTRSRACSLLARGPWGLAWHGEGGRGWAQPPPSCTKRPWAALSHPWRGPRSHPVTAMVIPLSLPFPLSLAWHAIHPPTSIHTHTGNKQRCAFTPSWWGLPSWAPWWVSCPAPLSSAPASVSGVGFDAGGGLANDRKAKASSGWGGTRALVLSVAMQPQ